MPHYTEYYLKSCFNIVQSGQNVLNILWAVPI